MKHHNVKLVRAFPRILVIVSIFATTIGFASSTAFAKNASTSGQAQPNTANIAAPYIPGGVVLGAKIKPKNPSLAAPFIPGGAVIEQNKRSTIKAKKIINKNARENI